MTEAVTTAAAESAPARAVGRRWDLDALRILAILAVVAIHVFGLILGNPSLKGTPTWTFGMVLDYGTRWCVPVFIMLSGALVLMPRAHADGPGPFLRRRVVRLLPALVAWHLIYLFVVRSYLREEDLDWHVVVVNLVDARIYTALYFLWLILGLYAVAPVIAAFLAGGGHRRAVTVAIAAITWSVVVCVVPGVTAQFGYPRPRYDGALTMWLPYVGVFVAGYAWREPRLESRRWLWTGPAAVVLMAEVVWQASVAPEHVWLQVLLPVGYTGLVVVLASIFLFLFGIDVLSRFDPPDRVRRVVRALSDATFGVFLCHLLIVALIQEQWPDWYADPAPVAKTELYVVVVVAAFTLTLLARQVPGLRRIF